MLNAKDRRADPHADDDCGRHRARRARPSGLAQINGFTEDFHNQIIEQIYGGDLNGNVWRWDVSDPSPPTGRPCCSRS